MREVLLSLMQRSYLHDFLLVGGTALALQIGHRRSIDLDLFSEHSFNSMIMADRLGQDYHPTSCEVSENTVSLIIHDIKIDIMTHAYPQIGTPIIESDFRLASLKDIAAMKMNAVAGRGLVKDYYDIYCLMNRYSLTEMINLYALKYDIGNKWHLIKALADIDSTDVDATPLPEDIKPNWSKAKLRIKSEVGKQLY